MKCVYYDMKKTLIGATLTLLSIIAAAQTGNTHSADIETIKKLNEAWIHSYPGKDTATLARIFADDIILINPAGTKMGKRAMLANLASSSGGQQITSTHVDSVDVQLLSDDIGLVFAKASFVSIADGKPSTGQTGYLDVYQKRNGRWVAIAAHVTYLGSK